MNINIQSPGFPVTPVLADHTRRRLRFGLTRHSHRIKRVVVRLGDQNGPRGGVDKFCHIRVYLAGAPMAVVVDIGSDLYEVIDRTADRVGRAVVRHLDRSRDSVRRWTRVDRRSFASPSTPHDISDHST
jgi:putative sigma-54 modulation protein